MRRLEKENLDRASQAFADPRQAAAPQRAPCRRGAFSRSLRRRALAAASPPDRGRLQVGDSQPGNYLAALIASADRDTPAAAVYYREALRADPRNPDLIERAFAAALANGDAPDAFRSPSACLPAIPATAWRVSRSQCARSRRGNIAAARAQLAAGEAGAQRRDDGAADGLVLCRAVRSAPCARCARPHSRSRGRRVSRLSRRTDRRLLGDTPEAQRRLKSAYDSDKNTLRFVDAYARFLARHSDVDGAKAVYADFIALVPHHPLIDQRDADSACGQAARAAGPQRQGRRSGGALRPGQRGHAGKATNWPALIYLRLSLYSAPGPRPGCGDAGQPLRGDEAQRRRRSPPIRCVPAASPMRESADIQVALELEGIGRADDAMQRLQEIVAARPQDADAWSALGRLQRSAKKYEDAAASYDKAIAAVGMPQRGNWTLFYFRGICFERAKQWPKAEADFKKALELYPGTTSGAELPRLFLGRSGHQSRRGVQDAAARGRFEAERRLYRRQPRLGAFQARPLPGSGRSAGEGDRSQAGRSGRQRPPRRRLLAGQPANRGAFPVEPRARHGAGTGRSSRDPEEDRVRPARRAERRRRRRPAAGTRRRPTLRNRRAAARTAARPSFVAAVARARPKSI